MRRDTAVAMRAIVALALGVAACGSKASGTNDAGDGGNVPVDGTAVADTAPAICDPVAQSCGAGMKCDFGCQGTTAVVACWPNGDGGVGAACTNTTTCTAGTACIAISTAGTACRKYCNVDGDCATGERCHNDTVTVGCGPDSRALSLHLCH